MPTSLSSNKTVPDENVFVIYRTAALDQKKNFSSLLFGVIFLFTVPQLAHKSSHGTQFNQLKVQNTEQYRISITRSSHLF
jgi:hypothetical protein